jgi:uncharacterized protein
MPNRLAQETSPYLQQHADNPVDWYPWSDAALKLAREQDKPILLSVGYSACHWCHVMAHESFEDASVAAVMNELFVSIKVDREERPDLDQIYQTAHYLLTQRNGGWPLTMFLTPDDQTPFFGGTYFPKSARYNLPGFPDLLRRVAELYRTRRDEINVQNASLVNALNDTPVAPHITATNLSDAPFAKALEQLRASFDQTHGGFGNAPKFPHPAELEFCLERHAANGDENAGDMVKLTLIRMAHGGLYDQLGGGFARYSVDQHWGIPHFEKMLYDNGPLLRLYTDGWLLWKEQDFQRVVEETAAWVLREMQSPRGGYYSTLDADSEHEEGKFYVWRDDEVRSLVSPEEYPVVAFYYGLDEPANFENSHWHFRIAKPIADVARGLSITTDEAQRRLASARGKLFAEREHRVRPGCDEKILVSWNALMVKAMARAGLVFDREDWIDSASRSVDFVRGTMWRDGALLATYKDGKAHLNAYLDDYAFLLDALIELMQARYRGEDLSFAIGLGDALLTRFEDGAAGGFFFTSHDHEKLIQRPKPAHDNATPSGNAIAARALQRLSHMTGDLRYAEAAERALKVHFSQASQHPAGFSSLLLALAEYLDPPQIVVIRGKAEELGAWQRAFAGEFAAHRLVFALPTGTQNLTAPLAKPSQDTVNAWICKGVTCLAPIADLRAALEVCKAGRVG